MRDSFTTSKLSLRQIPKEIKRQLTNIVILKINHILVLVLDLILINKNSTHLNVEG